MMETTHRTRDSSLTGLVAGLREDVRHLFKEEVQLAKTELGERLAHFKRNAVSLVIGGVVALLATVLLLASLSFLVAFAFEALGLSTGMSLFLGFLAIAVVAGAIGGILIGKAMSGFSKESLVPQQTIDTLKEIKDGGLEQVPVTIRKADVPQPEDTRSSEEIRDDVEKTRSRIGREVRGIRTHLRIATLASDVVTTVKHNPMRSVGIGLGTGVMGFIVMRVARLFGRRHVA